MIRATQQLPVSTRANENNSTTAVALPTLTVVICTCNRADLLLACVQSVIRQTVPPTELIVVDDGRLNEGEIESIEASCASAGISFLYLRNDMPGLPRSRNLAVRHARGDLIQFLDDDVTLAPRFLSGDSSIICRRHNWGPHGHRRYGKWAEIPDVWGPNFRYCLSHCRLVGLGASKMATSANAGVFAGPQQSIAYLENCWCYDGLQTIGTAGKFV